jgi:hypothetical protein
MWMTQRSQKVQQGDTPSGSQLMLRFVPRVALERAVLCRFED